MRWKSKICFNFELYSAVLLLFVLKLLVQRIIRTLCEDIVHDTIAQPSLRRIMGNNRQLKLYAAALIAYTAAAVALVLRLVARHKTGNLLA